MPDHATAIPIIRVVNEDPRLLPLMAASLDVRRHGDLFRWLQGPVQALFPHHALIVAWGDFEGGLIDFDVISPIAGLRTGSLDRAGFSALVAHLFMSWLGEGGQPITRADLSTRLIQHFSRVPDAATLAAVQRLRSAAIHGVKDQRGREDCLCIALDHDTESARANACLLELLLPFIDTALRRMPAFAGARRAANDDGGGGTAREFGLSARELEIMHWVARGKTNYEIAMILNISAFTVKNHLKRIFAKFDVRNRAQAVSVFEQLDAGSRE